MGPKSGGLENKTIDLQWSPPCDFGGIGRNESRYEIIDKTQLQSSQGSVQILFISRQVVASKSHDDNKVIWEGIPHVPFPCRLFLFLVFFCTPLSLVNTVGSTYRCLTSLGERVGF